MRNFNPFLLLTRIREALDSKEKQKDDPKDVPPLEKVLSGILQALGWIALAKGERQC
ncbi:hypothetical protein P3T73_00900 [Kiritimatiellota bacterium B12222]|nr:hypothetical protein P3T73_00900 [Kiritimatiellota bacterium B12222]